MQHDWSRKKRNHAEFPAVKSQEEGADAAAGHMATAEVPLLPRRKSEEEIDCQIKTEDERGKPAGLSTCWHKLSQTDKT